MDTTPPASPPAVKTRPAPYESVDAAAVGAQIAVCDTALGKYVDQIDYRNLSWYVSRASLRYVLGVDAAPITDDLWLAARCLQGRESMHLDRIPVEKFLTRRILPIELGLLSGQPAITRDLADGAGFSLPSVIANESEELYKEASRLTTFFRRGSCATHQDLAGLGAVVFGSALSAIARGFDDEAALGLNVFADAREPFQGVAAPEKVAPVLARYDRLLLSLACLLRDERDRLAHLLAEVVDAYATDLANKIGPELTAPTEPHPYLDLSALAILAIAALRGMEVPVPDQGPAAGYGAIFHFFMTSPPREVQPLSGLDEQSKAMLRSMGVSDEAIEGAHEPPEGA